MARTQVGLPNLYDINVYRIKQGVLKKAVRNEIINVIRNKDNVIYKYKCFYDRQKDRITYKSMYVDSNGSIAPEPYLKSLNNKFLDEDMEGGLGILRPTSKIDTVAAYIHQNYRANTWSQYHVLTFGDTHTFVVERARCR